MLCFVFLNVWIYILVYICIFFISMYVIIFLNKDKLFCVLSVFFFFCVNDIKLVFNVIYNEKIWLKKCKIILLVYMRNDN